MDKKGDIWMAYNQERNIYKKELINMTLFCLKILHDMYIKQKICREEFYFHTVKKIDFLKFMGVNEACYKTYIKYFFKSNN